VPKVAADTNENADCQSRKYRHLSTGNAIDSGYENVTD
jgi:hypothetical protein